MLVCSICNSKGKYKLIVDTGRFIHKLWYCAIHRPINIICGEIDDEQHDDIVKITLKSKEVSG